MINRRNNRKNPPVSPARETYNLADELEYNPIDEQQQKPADRSPQHPPDGSPQHPPDESPQDLPGESPQAFPESYHLPPRKWFFTFMCMNIPIAGWIYLLTKAYGKKENQLRDFAKAYLLYKLLFLVISLLILGFLVYVGIEVADRVLAYMEML